MSIRRLWCTFTKRSVLFVGLMLAVAGCDSTNPVAPSSAPSSPQTLTAVEAPVDPAPNTSTETVDEATGSDDAVAPDEEATSPDDATSGEPRYTVEGPTGCLEMGEHTWTITLRDADDRLRGASFFDPEAGCEPTDRRPGGGFRVLRENAPGVNVWEWSSPATGEACGRYQADIAVGSDSFETIVGVVINTGQHCEPEPPVELPTCEELGTCDPPPTCEELGTCDPPPTCEELGNCDPPTCEELGNCDSPPTCEELGNCDPPPTCEQLGNCDPPTCEELGNCDPPPTCEELGNCDPPPTCEELGNCDPPPTCEDLGNCDPPPTCEALGNCDPPTCEDDPSQEGCQVDPCDDIDYQGPNPTQLPNSGQETELAFVRTFCPDCVWDGKLEGGFGDSRAWTADGNYAVVLIKAGQGMWVFTNVKAGDVLQVDMGVSHVSTFNCLSDA